MIRPDPFETPGKPALLSLVGLAIALVVIAVVLVLVFGR